MNPSTKTIIILEGNIAAGKSTLAAQLKEHYGSRCLLFEEDWDAKCLFLKNYYSSADKEQIVLNEIAFQSFVITRFADIMLTIEKDESHDYFIIDRGILGSISFLKIAVQDNLVPNSIAKSMIRVIKCFWQEVILRQFSNVFSVYVDTPPEVCWQRYINRNPAVLTRTNPTGEWEGEMRIQIDQLKLVDISKFDCTMLAILKKNHESPRPFGKYFILSESSTDQLTLLTLKIKHYLT